MKFYLRLVRATTGTTLTVRSPIDTDIVDDRVTRMLHAFVECDYPGFEICDVWNEDQKLMSESVNG